MDFKKTLAFLNALKKNNSKEWFDENRKDWESIRKDFTVYIDSILKDISAFDKDITGLQAKDCMFRINKDIRFSKDKSPYKTNIGAGISKGGRKSSYAGYYIHIEPDNCFVAGGYYDPEPAVLKAIRQEIDYNLKGFEKILNHKDFKKHFGKMDGEKLANAPKGYDTSNPAIEHLKHKSFLAWHKFDMTDVYKKDFHKQIVDICKAMKPFDDFLNQAADSRQ